MDPGTNHLLRELLMHRIALSCIEEDIRRSSRNSTVSSVDQRKTVLWSDESKCEDVFGNHGYLVPQTEEERNHPAWFQSTVQKPASLVDSFHRKLPEEISLLKGIFPFNSSICCHRAA